MLRKVLFSVLTALAAVLPLAAQHSVVDLAMLVDGRKYAEGIALADSLVAEGDDSDAVMYFKGICHLNEGNLSAAGESLRYAYASDTSNVWYCQALISYYSVAKDYAGFFALSDILIRRPDFTADMKGRFVSGVIESLDANTYKWWHSSIDSLVLHCAQSEPFDSLCVLNAAQWFYGTGNRTLGTGFFEQLARICPDSPEPKRNLVAIRLSEKDHQGALDLCRVLLREEMTDSERSELLGTCADCLCNLSRFREGFKEYEKALELDPYNVSALNNYAYTLSERGKRLRKAEKMACRVIGLSPENPTFLDTYGWILHLRGKNESAREQFKRALVFGGKESATILEHYSAVLEALGQKDLAVYYKSLAGTRR